MSLRILFMGTPDFAVASLDALCQNGFQVVAVVTTPDKPAGRGQKMQPSPVKQYAVDKGLPVLQPEKLKDPDFVVQLQSYQPDLIVVVAFRMLPEIVWSMPHRGTLNVHGSLLPQYRGAAPINWAIINGDSQTGVTTFFIEKEIDTGKIIFTDTITIGKTENAGQVHDRLMVSGANLLVKTVRAIEAGNYPQIPQDELINKKTDLKPAPKIFKETCRINWNQDIEHIYNLIRGLSPYPAAWCELADINGKTLSVKIFDTELIMAKHSLQTGSINTDNKTFIQVAVNDGFINITSLQLEGKKRLAIDEFLRGFKNMENYCFK